MGCHCIQQFVLRTMWFVSHNCLLKIIIVSAREEKPRFSSIKGRLCRGTPFFVQTLVLFSFFLAFFFLSLQTRPRWLSRATNNRADSLGRFAVRRFTSRSAVKKPQNTQSLDESQAAEWLWIRSSSNKFRLYKAAFDNYFSYPQQKLMKLI